MPCHTLQEEVGDRQMVRDGTEILRVVDLVARLRAS
jgi:hypothetical protein